MEKIDSESDGLASSIDTICAHLDQFIVSQYERAYSVFIEEVGFDLGETVNMVFGEVPSKTFHLQSSFGHVIETLLLGEECPVHFEKGDIPVFVCEQWIFELEVPCPSAVGEQSIEHIQREIENYFTSSPLWFWLREHYQSKRYKLAHRVCPKSEASPNPGASFILSIGQVSSMSSLVQPKTRFNSRCTKKNTFASHSHPAIHTTNSKDKSSVDPWLSHTFSPVRVTAKDVLRLSVLSPKWMPAHLLECPLCCDPPAECLEDWSHQNDSKSRKLPPPIDVHQCEPKNDSIEQTNVPQSFPGVPGDLSVCKETLRSPTVVMTDVHNNFFHDVITDSLYDIPFYSVSGFDSATSTLTKKSRVSKSSDVVQTQLESPPRKQQRIGSESSLSGYPGTPQSSPRTSEQDVTNPNRGGTMDKVIAEFTQLNVERVNLSSSTGRLSCGSTDADKLCTQSFCLSIAPADDSCDTDICDAPLSHGVAKKREHPPKSSGSDCSSALANPCNRSALSGHLPRERRRNATSACIPTWSSSLHRDGQPFFNRRTGLPLQSSPVPLKRSTSGRFDFDSSLCSLKGSRSSTCMIYGLDNPKLERKSVAQEDSYSCDPVGSTRDAPNSSGGVQLRRRPASLRLHVPSNVQNGRHEAPVRRRACAPEVDQAEISCSAPPSGDRGSLHSAGNSRMANTLACTPLSHSSSQHLLVNFEESMLNGRIHPVGQVEGFTLELGASGSFFPAHERIPMKAYFFDLSDDNKPSPYLGYADLCQLRNGKGYHLPMKGSVQLTLFNPNKVVVKMFVIGYDFEDMPRNSQTFLRQRTVYMPIQKASTQQDPAWIQDKPSEDRGDSKDDLPSEDQMLAADSFGTTAKQTEALPPSSSVSSCSCSSLSSISSGCSLTSLSSNLTVNSTRSEQHAFLRYLVHLRFHTTRSGRLYLHTDIRLIFARDKFEFDPRVANYELRSFIDAPTNPRYSPKKWTKRPRTSVPFVPRITSP
ncbi:hypothetical protein T265_03299 [Opisthorchis viverrini]|uniref:Atos-like conserved domain-containing protein n=1 Tax=Opisthorchis viverrini TaxID=6198 RepID=A0A075AHP5_OPIVI|nr:hypothetical protein T265_03299 [Opisthorchis viverrini]KER30244.1 hypothetical protein T265_03299 [Opisthorchis viverrini]